MKNLSKIFFLLSFLFIASTQSLRSEILKEIIISGNERISDETLLVYGEIKKNKDYTQEDIDIIIKNLYDTKFFSNISINFSAGILKIDVKENPIINSITLQGEATKKRGRKNNTRFVYKKSPISTRQLPNGMQPTESLEETIDFLNGDR